MRPHSFTHDFPFCETFESMERSPAGEFLRNSRVLFPIVESIHLIGLALFVGTLLLIDLGLLGCAMRRQPVHEVAAALAPWTWSGFALLLLTGPFMFTAQAASPSPTNTDEMTLPIVLSEFAIATAPTMMSTMPMP